MSVVDEYTSTGKITKWNKAASVTLTTSCFKARGTNCAFTDSILPALSTEPGCVLYIHGSSVNNCTFVVSFLGCILSQLLLYWHLYPCLYSIVLYVIHTYIYTYTCACVCVCVVVLVQNTLANLDKANNDDESEC